MKSNTILSEYDINKGLYESFSNRVVQIIGDLVHDSNIQTHQISYRIKERSSLETKIKLKEGKYKSLEDITDIAGIRIITNYTDDVDKVSDIIQNEFEIDVENSIDKRKLKADQFGYMSLHYIISLSNNRVKLSENKKFKKLKLELQIRSILQHSWAEIEHDIGYKGSTNLPTIARRNFNRIAALLETADLEFIRLRDSLETYSKTVIEQIQENDENNDNIELNKESLRQAIINNKFISNLEDKVYKELNLGEWNEYIDLDIALNLLKKNNINYLSELIDSLKKNEGKIFKYATKRSKEGGKDRTVAHGITVFYLTREFLPRKP